MESRRDYPMDLMGADEEISVALVECPECPFVVTFPGFCWILWKSQDRTVVADTVMTVLIVALTFFGVSVQKLFLLLESF